MRSKVLIPNATPTAIAIVTAFGNWHLSSEGPSQGKLSNSMNVLAYSSIPAGSVGLIEFHSCLLRE